MKIDRQKIIKNLVYNNFIKNIIIRQKKHKDKKKQMIGMHLNVSTSMFISALKFLKKSFMIQQKNWQYLDIKIYYLLKHVHFQDNFNYT